MARALAHEASDAVRCCSELDRMRIILTLSRHCCTKLALWVGCGRSVLASAVAPRVVRSARESGSAAPARPGRSRSRHAPDETRRGDDVCQSRGAQPEFWAGYG